MNPPPAFEIRPIRAMDLPDVLAVYKQCEDFLALGPRAIASQRMVEDDFQSALASQREYSGIHLADDRLVGVVDTGPTSSDPPGLYIELLMIALPWRRQGLGAAVVERLAKQAAPGALHASMQVNNPDGMRFWQSLGFRVTGDPIPQPDGTVTVELERSR